MDSKISSQRSEILQLQKPFEVGSILYFLFERNRSSSSTASLYEEKGIQQLRRERLKNSHSDE